MIDAGSGSTTAAVGFTALAVMGAYLCRHRLFCPEPPRSIVEEDDDNIIGEVIASEGDLIGQLREKVGVELELGNSFLMELNGILLQHELDGAAIGPYLQHSNVLIIQ